MSHWKLEFSTKSCGIKVSISYSHSGCLLCHLSKASLCFTASQEKRVSLLMLSLRPPSCPELVKLLVVLLLLFTDRLSQLKLFHKAALKLDLGVCLRHLAEATLACPGILVTGARVALIVSQRFVCQAPLPVLFRERRLRCCNRKGHVVNWLCFVTIRCTPCIDGGTVRLQIKVGHKTRLEQKQFCPRLVRWRSYASAKPPFY